MSSTRVNLAESYGTDLSSRRRASELREEILAAAAVPEAGPVVIDCGHVRTISGSFADELFAVLVSRQGEDWFKQHVRVTNPSSAVRFAILQAVRNRIERAGQEGALA